MKKIVHLSVRLVGAHGPDLMSKLTSLSGKDRRSLRAGFGPRAGLCRPLEYVNHLVLLSQPCNRELAVNNCWRVVTISACSCRRAYKKIHSGFGDGLDNISSFGQEDEQVTDRWDNAKPG